MHDLMNLKEMLCEELAEYGKERELSPSSLQMIDILAHACKNVCKIIEAKEEEEYSMDGGSSRRGGSSYEGGSGRGGSYRGGSNRYSGDGYFYEDGGMSSRRRRNRMGRFTSRDASDMARKLREMMEEAPDEETKREIKKLAEKMEEM